MDGILLVAQCWTNAQGTSLTQIQRIEKSRIVDGDIKMRNAYVQSKGVFKRLRR